MLILLTRKEMMIGALLLSALIVVCYAGLLFLSEGGEA
jgi:hypothetical protein